MIGVRQYDEICCGHIKTFEAQDIQPVKLNAKGRIVRKVYIAPGTVKGITQDAYVNRIKRCLNALSMFTNTDFTFVSSASGAYVSIYPATNQMMWQWFPEYRPNPAKNYGGAVPLGASNGSKIYLASEITPVSKRERWGKPADLILEICLWHEFGHRLGLQHVSDLTSIMHIDLPVRKMNTNDVKKFQNKMGKAAA